MNTRGANRTSPQAWHRQGNRLHATGQGSNSDSFIVTQTRPAFERCCGKKSSSSPCLRRSSLPQSTCVRRGQTQSCSLSRPWPSLSTPMWVYPTKPLGQKPALRIPPLQAPKDSFDAATTAPNLVLCHTGYAERLWPFILRQQY